MSRSCFRHQHQPWEKCIPIGFGQMGPDEPVLEYRNCPECQSTITRESYPDEAESEAEQGALRARSSQAKRFR